MERSQVTPRTVWTVGAHVASMLVVGFVVLRATDVLAWILVSLLLAMALAPAVSWLHRHRVPRLVATLVPVTVVVGSIVLLISTFAPMLVEQVRTFVRDVPGLVANVQKQGWFAGLERIDERVDLFALAEERVRNAAGQAAGPLLGLVGGLLRAVLGLLTITVLTVFMLLFGRDVVRAGLAWIEPARRDHAEMLLDRMRRAVGGYAAGLMLVSAIDGTVMGITLALVGVPYFLPLALLTAILALIPFIGIFVAGALMVLMALAAAGSKAALIVLAVLLVFQQIENHVLHPMVQRRTIHLNPLLIALAMLVGTAVWGILGAVLAIPVAGVAQVLAQDALTRRRRARGEPEPVDDAPSGSVHDARTSSARA